MYFMQTGAMPKNFSKLCVTFCPNNLTIHWERLMDTLGWPSHDNVARIAILVEEATLLSR